MVVGGFASEVVIGEMVPLLVGLQQNPITQKKPGRAPPGVGEEVVLDKVKKKSPAHHRGEGGDVDVDELNRGGLVDVKPDGLDPAGDQWEVLDLGEPLDEVRVDERHDAAAVGVFRRGGVADKVREDPLEGGGVPAVAVSFLQDCDVVNLKKSAEKGDFTL